MSNCSKNMFDTYISYFPTIKKQLKLERGGRIKVIDIVTNDIEYYNNWFELNAVYKQVQSEEMVKEEKQITQMEEKNIKNKYFIFGHKTRYNEVMQVFAEAYNIPISKLFISFEKEDSVYFFDSNMNLRVTANDMVIDILQNSDWEELKLAEPIKFTKEDIAKMIGMDITQFEIV